MGLCDNAQLHILHIQVIRIQLSRLLVYKIFVRSFSVSVRNQICCAWIRGCFGMVANSMLSIDINVN